MSSQNERDRRSQKVREILDRAKAVITGTHVVYTSGKHGSAYINKDAVYPDWRNIEFLCRQIAQDFSDEEIDVVVGPVQGAMVLAYETARQITNLGGRRALWVYAEKETVVIDDPDRKCYAETGKFALKRGYDKLIAGKHILIVEDVLTTGISVRKVVDLVRGLGGEILGVAALVNRGGVKSENIGNPPKFISLLDVQMDAWDEKDCKLCANDVPVNVQVGKGKEFLTRKAAIPA